MRPANLILLLAAAGCSTTPTTLLVLITRSDGNGVSLPSAHVSVFDSSGVVARGDIVPATLPGSLLVKGLSDVATALRVVVTATTGGQPLVGGTRITTQPKKQTRVEVVLDAATADGDGDGVPDTIDDCPTAADPDQVNGAGNGPGDACRSDGGVADLAMPPDLPPSGPDMVPALCAISGGAGSALAFDGSAVTFVDVGALPVPADFTIEAWIRPTAPLNEQVVLSKDTAGVAANQWRFGIDGSNVYFVMSGDDGSTHGLGHLMTTDTVPTNQWSHVAVTKSGTRFTIYIDGVESVSGTSSVDMRHVGTMSARIGARNPAAGGASPLAFNGRLDEIRLWNVARSAAAIACARRGEIDPADPQWANLVDYWKLDENGGITARDSRGAFDGTLVNGPTWQASGAF